MALTSNHVNNELIKFRRTAASDFLRKSRFDPFMGADSTSVIVRMNDLAADGKEINIPLVTQLTGSGVGAGTLRGYEEQLDSYGFPVWADWARNAVANNRAVNKESSFNIRSTARSLLSGWSRRIVRDDIVDALLSIPTASVQAGRLTGANGGNRVNGVKWSAATTAQKNAWTAANQDRVVFGSAIANYSTTFATAVANVDSTSDKMSAAVGSLMKAQAQQSGVSANNPGTYNGLPKITPFQMKSTDQEWYVCFLGSRAMRDLKADPTMYQANRDAREREGADPTKTNPLFTGGGLIYDGVIYLEIPEITQRLLLAGVGTSSIAVEPVFLCGQAALAYAMGQMPRPTQLEDGDYEFITGMGIEAQYGVGKIAKASLFDSSNTLVDWGMVTGFVSGVANA
jgi:Protein of unknown function (DUF4043)